MRRASARSPHSEHIELLKRGGIDHCDRGVEPTWGPQRSFAAVGRAETRVARRLSRAVSTFATAEQTAEPNATYSLKRKYQISIECCSKLCNFRFGRTDVSADPPPTDISGRPKQAVFKMTFEMFLIKYCDFSLQNLCIGN